MCIGAVLTLMEAQAVFAHMLRRWPGLQLVDAVPSWNANPVYRGLTGLQVIDSDFAARNRSSKPSKRLSVSHNSTAR